MKKDFNRIQHVERFIPVTEQEIVRSKDIVFNFFHNTYPYPVKLGEIFMELQNEGYSHSMLALRVQLYRLRRERKIDRVKTPRGVFWIRRKQI